MFRKIIIVYSYCIILLSLKANAQDFMLQGWYWDYPKTAQGALWCDTLINKGAEFSNAGYTYIWAPPMNVASGGGYSNGYDIRDYFSVGNSANAATGFGYRSKINDLRNIYNSLNLKIIGDLIYNHRSGGVNENNPAVGAWIKNYTSTKHIAGDECYPSDRYRCRLTIGGNTGRGAGIYYFRIKSASQHSDYFNKPYSFIATTNKKGANGTTMNETQNNGGSLCGQPNDVVLIGKKVSATIDNSGCGIDEFQVVIDSVDFYAAGDNIIIELDNINGDYADQYIHSLYFNTLNAELKDSVMYETATNFIYLQSGRGKMDWQNFKPNGNPTNLNGDWDKMLFFYDLDQFVPSTRDTLNEYTRWMWDTIGIRGIRADAVKNFAPDYIGQLLNYLNANNINPEMFVGESYDYNPAVLKGWVDAVKSKMNAPALAAIAPRIFDFALQGSMKEACDNGSFDARNIFTSGIVDGAGGSGFNTVSFVNNHDFRDSSQSADYDQILAYVYLMTNNSVGLPCVFYTDYYKNNYYTSTINNLMSLHKKFIFNTAFKDYLNRFSTPFASNYISGSADKCLIYQMSGGGNVSCLPNRDVIIAINFGYSPLKVDHAINTGAPFHSSQGDTLQAVMGSSNFPYAIVNSNNQIYIDLPPRSFGIWVKVNAIAIPSATISQTNICAGDSSVLTCNTATPCVSYQWVRNAVNIPLATKPNYIARQSGNYQCITSYFGAQPKISNTVTLNVSPDMPILNANANTLNVTGVIQAVTYQWYYSSDSTSFAIVPGGIQSQLQNCSAGYYYVIVTDGSGCTNVSQVYTLTFAGLSAIYAQPDLVLVPNPAKDILNLKLKTSIANATITVFNNTGQKLLSVTNEISNTHFTIDVATLPSGNYFVSIKNNEVEYRRVFQKL